MKPLIAVLLLIAAPALAQEGGKDPFALRTPGVTTVIPTDGSAPRQAAPAQAARPVQSNPSQRPAADRPAPTPR